MTDSKPRPCELCGRDENVVVGRHGPARCVSCAIICYDACPDEHGDPLTGQMIRRDLPATLGINGDCYPATVTDVRFNQKDGHIQSITIRQDRISAVPKESRKALVSLSDGVEDEQCKTFTRRKRGNFVEKGAKRGCFTVSVGGRTHYMDPSF